MISHPLLVVRLKAAKVPMGLGFSKQKQTSVRREHLREVCVMDVYLSHMTQTDFGQRCFYCKLSVLNRIK